MKTKIIVGVVLLTIIGGWYLTYKMKKSLNYSLEYKGQVEKTVCGMIKKEKHQEFLVNPKVCD